MKNSASRSKLIESVRQWKESELGSYFYRPASERINESEISLQAPWLPSDTDGAHIEESEQPSSFRTCWMVESEVDGKFTDLAEQHDAEGLSELISSIGGDDRVAEAVVTTLQQNEGKVMLLAREEATEGYAIACSEGSFLIAGMELEEEIMDEGLISMTFLASKVPAPQAPVVPGPLYGLLESQNSLFETLNASVTLLNSLRESEVDTEFVQIIEKFNADLADVLGELSIDEGTLTERELDFLCDMFEGLFAGLAEEAVLQVNESSKKK